MLGALYQLARPMLFRLAPEDAHELMLKGLESGAYPRDMGADEPCLAVNALGLTFPNPISIAAGFDKDARVPDAVIGLGCGFAEVGTITPKPQSGNPSPRVFRLVEDNGLINRLGFNNKGHALAYERLSRRNKRGIIAINVGANKDSADRTEDYVTAVTLFYDLASLFTINISSPNTPGLRDLQAPAALDDLLSRVMAARACAVSSGKPRRPIVVKLAPDVAEDDIAPIVERILAHGADGIAVSNTTLARDGLRDASRSETGGLSGRPLFQRSTVMLAKVYLATEGKVPLIGIGGIDSGQTALAKLEAGATLLQLYTGLIYEGPGLIGRIKSHLAEACRREGLASVSALTGRTAAEWAAKPLT
jgi:dihydroorotate dehydrogenase